jgi:hypothetical protein
MNSKASATIAAMAAFLALAISVQSPAQKIITLDAPGADTTSGSFNGTFASGMNNRGVVTGSYVDANNVYHGFLRSPEGSFTTFEAPGADTTAGSFNGTSPNSINDLGAITGSYSDANGFSHGFLRSREGEFTTFEVPGAGGYGSFPIALNLEGAVVGYYTDPNYNFHAFLRSRDGKFATFVGPGACDTGTSTGCYGNEATNINLFGTSVGNYMDVNFVGHGLIRSPDGALTTFDAPDAGTGTNQGTGCPGCSSGFNVWGAIAATYTDTNNVHHGFIRSPDGALTTFDAPGAGTGAYQGTGCSSDCPVSLNDWGAITGTYIDANFVYHGYLRSPQGKFVTVDPPGSAFTLPYSINDSGAITGYYIDANNVFHGFLWIPN